MKKFYLLFLMALLPLVVSAHEFIEVNGINYCLNRETKTVIVVCKFNGYFQNSMTCGCFFISNHRHFLFIGNQILQE